MAITVNLRYTGKGGAARKFAEEMTASGTVAAIRAEAGNNRVLEGYLNIADILNTVRSASDKCDHSRK